jgi:arylsulfatase
LKTTPHLLSRKEFLKIACLAPISALLGQASHLFREPDAKNVLPNIIIIVYDALSALDLSLYGYHRKTSSNLERFAQHATVFHSHYSAANFTTPGVASLLTGSYPWTHRAFHESGLINPSVVPGSLFHNLGDDYFKIAFSQNHWADLIMRQMAERIDRQLDPGEFSLFHESYSNKLFSRDPVVAFKSLDEFQFSTYDFPGSILLSYLGRKYFRLLYEESCSKYRDLYPRGLPRSLSYPLFFMPETLTDGAINLLKNLTPPSLVYLHFLPPHEPYFPRREFIGIFDDGMKTIEKKKHFLSPGHPDEFLRLARREYDEYVANADAEFGRIYDFITQSDFGKNCYLVVTSDHGEMFERGVLGHVTQLLYEPVIRVPLLISKPGQTERVDVHFNTSSVDLLPTLFHLNGKSDSFWSEGRILPGFSKADNAGRSIFVVEAKSNPVNRPISKATIAMIKDRYKLIYYAGYPGLADGYELYDLRNDPEELENLYNPTDGVSADLQFELEDKLRQVNAAYRD